MNHLSTYRVLAFCLSLGVSASQLLAADITVNWNDVHQTITGFGASVGDGGNHVPAKAAEWIYNMPEPGRTQCVDLLFDSTKGIGFNMFRAELSYFMQTEGGTFDISKDNPAQVWLMKEAQKRGKMNIWPAPWTPPLWMKTQQVYGGGELDPAHYQDYANYMSNYIRQSKSVNGIDMMGISIQNEPNFTPSYGGCAYNGAQLNAYAKVLGATFDRDGVSAKIVLADVNEPDGFVSMVTPALNDAVAVKYIGACAFHVYSGSWPIASDFALCHSKGKEVWETETSVGPWSGQGDQGGGWAVGWAKQVHACLTIADATSWHMFWFAAGGNGSLLDIANGAPAPAPRFWYMGHYSKFVRPGWVRIGTTPTQVTKNGGTVYISAFKHPTNGKFAIVALNEGITKPGPTVSFQINGLASIPSTVTPYLSTADLSPNLAMAKQADVPVTNGTFSVTLYNVGIATVTGNGPAVSVASPAPAAGLERSMRIETMRGGIMVNTQRAGKYQVELLSLNGKRLASWSLSGAGQQSLSTKGIAAGAAVAILSGEGSSISRRLLISR